MRASGLRMQDPGTESGCRTSVTFGGTQSVYGISERDQRMGIENTICVRDYLCTGLASGISVRDQCVGIENTICVQD